MTDAEIKAIKAAAEKLRSGIVEDYDDLADMVDQLVSEYMAREREIDAGRWRRLINASEMAFPALAIAEDPDNYCVLHYGRKALEKLVDRHDEISETYQSGDTGRLDWLANNPVEALDIFGHTRPGEAREVRIDIDAAMSGF